jgi:hypothetical protein
MQILKQQTRLFKSAFLAGGINANQHLFNGEDGRKSVHIEGGLCTLGGLIQKKPHLNGCGTVRKWTFLMLYIMRFGALW